MTNLRYNIKHYRNNLHLSHTFMASYISIPVDDYIAFEDDIAYVYLKEEDIELLAALFGISVYELQHGSPCEKPENFTELFESLDDADKEEILSLMRFKKAMKRNKNNV